MYETTLLQVIYVTSPPWLFADARYLRSVVAHVEMANRLEDARY